jgi:SagB-type dehydrogenase family enzyme
MVEATGGEPSVTHAPIVLAFASTYWRNSWKYQTRAYRHCFWDSGTILANLAAAAAADAVPLRVVTGFVDDAVNSLLSLDPQREGPLALVMLGCDRVAAMPHAAVAPMSVETLPLSVREVEYPAIREMHAASSLQTPDEVRAWRDAAAVPVPPLPPVGELIPLRPLADPLLPRETIDSVITRRGSTREFAHVPITFEQLSTLLDCARCGIATDYGETCNDLYLIVNAVEGMAPGTYVYQRDAHALRLLRAGNFRRTAGSLGLGQDLPADASVNIYMLCTLEPLLARFGNRGYRIAQLDAAITGGRLYLAAYAMRLGATGLTFFDDDVIDFLSPHAAGKSVMFLMAVGRGRKSGEAA